MVTRVATLSGDWDVRFQPGRGGPASSQTLAAGSWTLSNDPAVRYFSGTAAYSKDLQVPRSWFREGARLILDLGEVRELAEVRVNDRSLGVLWHSPYRLDITDALHSGGNRIELGVTNLWVNRLIGDAQPGARKSRSRPIRLMRPMRRYDLVGAAWTCNARSRVAGRDSPLTTHRFIVMELTSDAAILRSCVAGLPVAGNAGA